MTKPIGAVATIRWTKSNEINKGYYFSFEDFPQGADPDTYILPLAKIADEQVFMYCTEADIVKWSAEDVALDEFEILEYVMITPECSAPEEVTAQ